MIPVTEAIVGGVLLSALSTVTGIALGGRNKLSKEDFQRICSERQSACTHNMCIELKHIKDEQAEMKRDIKELLKRVN
jgi:hypothetical protein